MIFNMIMFYKIRRDREAKLVAKNFRSACLLCERRAVSPEIRCSEHG